MYRLTRGAVSDLGPAAEPVGDDRRVGAASRTAGSRTRSPPAPIPRSGRVRSRNCLRARSIRSRGRRAMPAFDQLAVGVEAENGVLVAVRLHRAPPPPTWGGCQPDSSQELGEGRAVAAAGAAGGLSGRSSGASRAATPPCSSAPDRRSGYRRAAAPPASPMSADAPSWPSSAGRWRSMSTRSTPALRQHHLVSGGLQHLDRRAAHLGCKVIGEVSGHSTPRRASASSGRRLTTREPRREGLLGEGAGYPARARSHPGVSSAPCRPPIHQPRRPEANRDSSGSQPIDQCDSGRAHGRRRSGAG